MASELTQSHQYVTITVKKGGRVMEFPIKNIEGFENFDGYTIDENGVVRTYFIKGMNRKFNGVDWDKKPSVMSASIKSNGYKHLGIYGVDGKVRYPTIHRLLALAFIPNPYNLEQVNHKDGDKLNNSLENLEWVSRQRNAIHAYETGLNNRFKNGMSKSVVQYDLQGNYIADYLCITDAIESIGLKTSSKSAITRVCRGTQKTCGGYNWKYKSDVKGSTTS